eukprot:CAMPEP_0171343974 /NCGR_PEP_ID=MMETSP0878-20121228/18361_1 /TAXON_ID=67004 /ORGANISM="Thalassiosira weissflogii, Strain CCMP1336" /LENGTH=326 /DNA_ID=CAMNT_0011847049 /DNA_START=183 /DNA_END=1163 /DNA_ORIENTATION=-
MAPSQSSFAASTASSIAARAAFGVPLSSLSSNNNMRRRHSLAIIFVRGRNGNNYLDDDDDEFDPYYDDSYDDVDEQYDYPPPSRSRQSQRRSRRPEPPMIDDLGAASFSVPSPFNSNDGPSSSSSTSLRLPASVSASLLAGTFILGIGTGVTVDSQINTNPRDLASRDAIDKNAPNPTLCTTYGASAMAFDQRVFVSFNPFNVYVAQADVKPACVLRPANVVPVLKERKLLNDGEIRACKNNMNTWAFVGDLEDQPQLSCVYKSEDAQNEFLEGEPKRGIGEDYLDDDLERFKKGQMQVDTRKMVKDGLTEGQKQKQQQQQQQMMR